jgi:hypothetical protein
MVNFNQFGPILIHGRKDQCRVKQGMDSHYAFGCRNYHTVPAVPVRPAAGIAEIAVPAALFYS